MDTVSAAQIEVIEVMPMTTSKQNEVLMIVTSHAQLGTSGQKTGFWLEELAAPYYELLEAGFAVDIASPLGGKPPADPKSESSEAAAASGAPLVKGKRVAGFSNEEEVAVGLAGIVPFALETRLRELGGLYERGPTWGSFAARDERLVTGQNPASSAAVAKLVVEVFAS